MASSLLLRSQTTIPSLLARLSFTSHRFAAQSTQVPPWARVSSRSEITPDPITAPAVLGDVISALSHGTRDVPGAPVEKSTPLRLDDFLDYKRWWKSLMNFSNYFKDGSIVVYNHARLAYILHKEKRAGRIPLLPREEFHLLRFKQDIKVLIPFGILWCLPFSMIPFLVIVKVFPNMMPAGFHPIPKETYELSADRKLALAKTLESLLEHTIKKAEEENIKLNAPISWTYFDQGTNGLPHYEFATNNARAFTDKTVLDLLTDEQIVRIARMLNIPLHRDVVKSVLGRIQLDNDLLNSIKLASLTPEDLLLSARNRGWIAPEPIKVNVPVTIAVTPSSTSISAGTAHVAAAVGSSQTATFPPLGASEEPVVKLDVHGNEPTPGHVLLDNDLNRHTVSQLRTLCKQVRIPDNGTREELLRRLALFRLENMNKASPASGLEVVPVSTKGRKGKKKGAAAAAVAVPVAVEQPQPVTPSPSTTDSNPTSTENAAPMTATTTTTTVAAPELQQTHIEMVQTVKTEHILESAELFMRSHLALNVNRKVPLSLTLLTQAGTSVV